MTNYLRLKIGLLVGVFVALLSTAFCVHLLAGWPSAMWFWGAAAAYPTGFMVATVIHSREWMALSQASRAEAEASMREHDELIRRLGVLSEIRRRLSS